MQMSGLSHRLWRCSCPESLAPTHPFLSHPCLRSWPWASCKYPLYCGTSAALTGCRALPVRCLMMHLGKAKKWDKGRSWESSSVNVRAVMMSIQASLMQDTLKLVSASHAASQAAHSLLWSMLHTGYYRKAKRLFFSPFKQIFNCKVLSFI